MNLYTVHADLELLIRADSDEEMQDIITEMFDDRRITVTYENYDIGCSGIIDLTDC